MGDDTVRQVRFERTAHSRYQVHNSRGGSLSVASGAGTDFTPVELLLAAIGICSAIDVDAVTSRRAEPIEFRATVRGDKVRDPDQGNRLENLVVDFAITFPEGTDGDQARDALPRALMMSHDRLCTVSRTIELGTPVSTTLFDKPLT